MFMRKMNYLLPFYFESRTSFTSAFAVLPRGSCSSAAGPVGLGCLPGSRAGARGCHWGCPACAAQTQLEAARGLWHHGQAPEGPSSSEGDKALCWHWPHPVLRAGQVTGLPCPISIAGPASSVLLAPLPRSDCVPSGRKVNLGREEIESGGGQTS